jgi:4-aminobutyrate aminotransferase-like enzyme
MSVSIQHANESSGNSLRDQLAILEPRSLRTFTPTQAVIARSAGVFHWTADNRRLYDYTSGVLVSNLGHNPTKWMRRYAGYMGWPSEGFASSDSGHFTSALAMTAYNAITPVEVDASSRLVSKLRNCPGGNRLQQVMWGASGSEAIQKALWAAMARDRARPMIIATRFGFHGKKGLANAVTGSEADPERDPRVRFISFPMTECHDLSNRSDPFDPSKYQAELDALLHQFGPKIGTLITEPYLGGGGSYHPPKAYLQLLDKFCHENDIVFILDEVQSNFWTNGINVCVRNIRH